jgi:hypothetical protein
MIEDLLPSRLEPFYIKSILNAKIYEKRIQLSEFN